MAHSRSLSELVKENRASAVTQAVTGGVSFAGNEGAAAALPSIDLKPPTAAKEALGKKVSKGKESEAKESKTKEVTTITGGSDRPTEKKVSKPSGGGSAASSVGDTLSPGEAVKKIVKSLAGF